MKSLLRPWAFTSCLGILLLVLLSAPARAELLEAVVAQVNSDAILLSDLRLRAGPAGERVMEIPEANLRRERLAALYTQVREALIQERLIQQAATTMQIRVTEAEVERALAGVRQENGLDEISFWRAVEGQGISRQEYRRQISSQLLQYKVINQRARGRVNVTEEAIRRRYDEQVARASRSLRLTLAHLHFAFDVNTGGDGQASIRARAQAIRSQITTIQDFEERMPSSGGQELGAVLVEHLPESLSEPLAQLQEGDISDVLRGPNGYHIFLLRQREFSSASLPSFESQRTRIYQEIMQREMGRQRELFFEELRRRAHIRLHPLPE